MLQKIRDLHNKFLYEGYPAISLGPDIYFDADDDLYYEDVNQALKDAFEEGISFALECAAHDLQKIYLDAELETK